MKNMTRKRLGALAMVFVAALALGEMGRFAYAEARLLELPRQVIPEANGAAPIRAIADVQRFNCFPPPVEWKYGKPVKSNKDIGPEGWGGRFLSLSADGKSLILEFPTYGMLQVVTTYQITGGQIFRYGRPMSDEEIGRDPNLRAIGFRRIQGGFQFTLTYQAGKRDKVKVVYTVLNDGRVFRQEVR